MREEGVDVMSERGLQLDKDGLVESHIEGLVPYEPGKPIDELRRELGLERIIKLASNENPFGSSPVALGVLAEAFGRLNLYPDPRAHALKQALSERLGVGADELLVSHGSNEAINLVLQTFFSPGCEAIFPRYAFAIYKIGCQICGMKWREVAPLDGGAFGIDLDALLGAINDNTKFILIDNPNNPTGAYVGEDALRRFLQKVPAHVIVVLDEAYCEYATALDYPDGLKLRELHPNLLVMRTFSKVYGLAGLRVGYTVGRAKLIDYLNRVRAPFNVNTLGMVAAVAALGDEDFMRRGVEHNKREMARVLGVFDEMGLKYERSQGNFVLLSLPCDGRVFFERMLRQGVIVRPLGGYGLKQHVRVSIGLSEEMDVFLEALPRCLAA